MNRRLQVWFAILLGAAPGVAVAGEVDPPGQKIMDEWDARNQLRDEILEGTTHVFKDFKLMGRQINMNEKRRTTTWSLRYGKNNVASVLRYHSPKDLENLSVLTYKDQGYANKYVVWQWDPDKKPNGQLKQTVGPLSLESKSSSFAGTDFTFEDIEPEDLDSCAYAHVADEKLVHPYDKKLSGADCYVVEAYKKPGHGSTGYFKRVLWVEKQRYLGIKVEFYDSRTKKLEKTLWSWDFVEAEPGIWRSNESEMKWHNGNTWTRMSLSNRRANPGIPPWFFQPNILKLTDGSSLRIIEEMWGIWARVEAMRKERDELKAKVEAARQGDAK